jgi:hypothetical protein
MRILLTFVAATLLAGCANPGTQTTLPGANYAEHTASIQAKGGYWTVRIAPDAPYRNADPIRNLELIALFDEYDRAALGFVASQTPSPLSRWEGPVKIRLQGTRSSDRVTIYALARRLGAIASRQVSFTDSADANVDIFVLDAQARAVLLAEISNRQEAEELLYIKEWANDYFFHVL